jgi:hypothetical protein
VKDGCAIDQALKYRPRLRLKKRLAWSWQSNLKSKVGKNKIMLVPNTKHWLEVTIERGIEIGLRRAYKHTDEPTKDDVGDAIYNSIWEGIVDGFNFSKEDER